ncbi:MAG: AraC family transcriptional regulator [Clostridiaceae bacterium]|nr:AraC family transcriptional regulator [Clostridiaceae bacterium]
MSYFCKNRRIWSLLTALLVASVLLLSGLFIVTHGKHDCTGEDCRVCSEIKVCVSTIRILSEAVGTGAAVVFVYIAAHKLVFSYIVGFFLCPASLVSLKIRLDN